MQFSGQVIYFDNYATTPVDNRVLDAMLPFMAEYFANASSIHHFASVSNVAVRNARTQISRLIGAEEDEIIFTSGSTEAINIALKGIANYNDKGKHIITATTEHPAVIETCKYLESIGYEISFIPVDSAGSIDLSYLEKSLKTDTVLVCVMYVNNETGVIQPIREIASMAHNAGALFMSDTTQAVGKLRFDVDELGIDFLCISGHKMYAPKGIGALYKRRSLNKLNPFVHGGGQEKGIRSGTLNVPGIVALGKACQIASEEMEIDTYRISALRDELESGLLEISGTYMNGNHINRIYNVTNICFPGQDAEVLINRMENVAVSNGSACTSAVMKPSHVLKSMGLSDSDAFASLRFSLGKFNTGTEVKEVLSIIRQLIKG